MNELLSELQSKGLILELLGNDLLLRGEKVDLPTLEKIKKHKDQLKTYLKSQDSNSKPRIGLYGDLIIPFDSSSKYHYWNGGQSIEKTLDELTVMK